LELRGRLAFHADAERVADVAQVRGPDRGIGGVRAGADVAVVVARRAHAGEEIRAGVVPRDPGAQLPAVGEAPAAVQAHELRAAVLHPERAAAVIVAGALGAELEVELLGRRPAESGAQLVAIAIGEIERRHQVAAELARSGGNGGLPIGPGSLAVPVADRAV